MYSMFWKEQWQTGFDLNYNTYSKSTTSLFPNGLNTYEFANLLFSALTNNNYKSSGNPLAET